jgi:hypothetical protein
LPSLAPSPTLLLHNHFLLFKAALTGKLRRQPLFSCAGVHALFSLIGTDHSVAARQANLLVNGFLVSPWMQQPG